MRKQALVHMKISGAIGVRDSQATIVKLRVPDKPVERIEILYADPSERAPNEQATLNRILSISSPVGSSRLDSERQILKHHVGKLIVGREGPFVSDCRFRL